jgi:3-hydroxyanthranilate 3,4-dioxygenase
MGIGDHVYIPAGTPHRIVPVAEGVLLRFQPQSAGLQGAAWYCDSCDSELRRYEWEHDHDTPAVQYYAAACARFSSDEAARTCGKCGTVAAPLDLAAFGWPPPEA